MKEEQNKQINKQDDDDLMEILFRVYENTSERFVMIIDEWDAIMRERGKDAYQLNSCCPPAWKVSMPMPIIASGRYA